MKKLIQGIVDFRKNLREENRELFAKLALGQKPDALFIACSDSRVVPNLFASTNPGDLFVIRNVGNLIPPSGDPHEASSQAAIAYSVLNLNVSNIIVCGHSECGAMKALSEGVETLCCPHLSSWLTFGEEAKNKVLQGETLNPKLTLENQVSQMNVLLQMQHILSYPFVKERVEQKKLGVHGWWFDIAEADVYCFESYLNQFVLIDENEAQLILERLA